MKLSILLEAVNNVKKLVDRDDLIAILDIFEQPHNAISGNCFLIAIAKSLSLQLDKPITIRQLADSLALRDVHANFHPKKVKQRINVNSRDVNDFATAISSEADEALFHWYDTRRDILISAGRDPDEIVGFRENLEMKKKHVFSWLLRKNMLAVVDERMLLDRVPTVFYDASYTVGEMIDIIVTLEKHMSAFKSDVLKLDYKLLKTHEQIKQWVRKGVPVILSIAWNKPLYYTFADIRDGKAQDDTDRKSSARANGASEEFIEKAKRGIISMPNPEMIEALKGENDSTKHAVLCVGFDASEDAFICKDYLGNRPSFEGFFKIEREVVFNKLLNDHQIPMVEAAVAIFVDEHQDVIIAPNLTSA